MTTPTDRQPVFNVPGVVLGLLALLAAIEAGRGLLPDATDAHLLARFAFVPGRLTAAIDPGAVRARLADLASAGSADALLAGRFFLGSGSLQPWTAATYAFLHGGWVHVGLNGVWLLAFGSPVARRLGVTRFLALFGAGAVAGAGAHYATDPLGLQPLVGASAAVSACMGAALRFLFTAPRPGDDPARPAERPRVSLGSVLRDRQAAAFLVLWMVTNLATGVAAVPAGLSDMPIAWQAHVGGFLLGLLAFPLFDPVRAGGSAPPPTDPAPGGPA